MKIPESVRIHGVEYPVKYTANLNDGVNLCYGHIDEELKHILRNTPKALFITRQKAEKALEKMN